MQQVIYHLLHYVELNWQESKKLVNPLVQIECLQFALLKEPQHHH